ncbi:MAG TPA: hypothetical protein VNH64_12135 [Parvularculaceae bacterium]|nr:hypothetical protein [Parvularculaceae bacterium]
MRAEQAHHFAKFAEIFVDLLHGDEIESRNDFGDEVERFRQTRPGIELMAAEIADVPCRKPECGALALARNVGGEPGAKVEKPGQRPVARLDVVLVTQTRILHHFCLPTGFN